MGPWNAAFSAGSRFYCGSQCDENNKLVPAYLNAEVKNILFDITIFMSGNHLFIIIKSVKTCLVIVVHSVTAGSWRAGIING